MNLILISKDPACWKANNYWQEIIALCGFDQNFNTKFKLSRRVYISITRFCSITYFFFNSMTAIGEQILRKLLV